MNIAHIIDTIDKAAGGPSRSSTQLIDAILKNEQINIDLYTLESKEPVLKKFNRNNGNIFFNRSNFYGYSNQLKEELNKDFYDLLHGHGLWQYPVHQMAVTARKLNKPYLISPRGMLESWSLKQKKNKKRIALKLFQKGDLELASCLHATAKMEAESLRAMGLKNPIAVIPNGISTNEFSLGNEKKNDNKILFLSRIHPKKGIELLIESWAELNPSLKKGWSVDIVGNGEEDYIQKLKNLIAKKNLKGQIQILPPIYNREKISYYQKASLFVLPTYSENFGIVIAEALACGTPVITTKGTPWSDLEKYNCGWWIDIGRKPLVIALENALQQKQSDLDKMGINGRNLIEEKYSIDAVAKQMTQTYQWLLGKTSKPEFVDIY